MGQAVCRALTYRPRPATQCTATQQPGSSQNLVFNKLSQSSTILLGGGAPSSNGQSCKVGAGEERNTVRPWGKTQGIAFYAGRWSLGPRQRGSGCVCQEPGSQSSSAGT